METVGAATRQMGGVCVAERGLGHGDTVAPLSVADQLAERGMVGASVTGLCDRVAIRPGFDLLLYDLLVAQDHASTGTSPPSLAMTIMLEGEGDGWLLDSAGAVLGPTVRYRAGALYLCLANRHATGGYRLSAGSRFRFVELRLDLNFTERIGVAPLFAAAGVDHPFHHVSADGVWIGIASATAAMIEAGEALIALGRATPRQDLRLEGRALALLSDVMTEVERASLRAGAGAAPRLSGADLRRIDQARRMIDAEPAGDWTIGRLARAAGLNERKLKAGFRVQAGTSVRAYLQDARLSAARALIEDGRANVTEAALAVGYANPSYFARLFRRRYGMAPGNLTG